MYRGMLTKLSDPLDESAGPEREHEIDMSFSRCIPRFSTRSDTGGKF
jgi:hypothetical protein